LSPDWLIKFVEDRIGDRRIIRLIQKWLKAGVLEDGRLIETTEGTQQGSVVSPLLANVYLHYVYDLWVEQWRSRHARGDMIVVRYADDTIVGFQHRHDAERFLSDLKERLAAYALSLHPKKTRLIEFGRYAAERRSERGLGKPETFDFLGYVSSALMLCPTLMRLQVGGWASVERNIIFRATNMSSQCPQETDDARILAPRLCPSRLRDITLIESSRFHLQVDLRVDMRCV
jgi:hypothetical protein